MDTPMRRSVFCKIRTILSQQCLGHSADEIAAMIEKEMPGAVGDELFKALQQTLVGQGYLRAIGMCRSRTGVEAITYRWVDKPAGYSSHCDLFLFSAVNYAMNHPTDGRVNRKLETIF